MLTLSDVRVLDAIPKSWQQLQKWFLVLSNEVRNLLLWALQMAYHPLIPIQCIIGRTRADIVVGRPQLERSRAVLACQQLGHNGHHLGERVPNFQHYQSGLEGTVTVPQALICSVLRRSLIASGGAHHMLGDTAEGRMAALASRRSRSGTETRVANEL